MNFKEQLYNDIADERITNIVNDNVYFLHKNENVKTNTYIEYEIITEKYDNYYGNNNKTVNYVIQVDIFSKYDYSDLEQIIKTVLKEKDYRFSNGADLYEEDTKLYHKAMRFNKVIMQTN